ncbi:MAG: hypothetical protein CL609_12950 [Anaerolineaceae bacterium]|nr:hypothetical protein [Anaerolineaceae bacterium]
MNQINMDIYQNTYSGEVSKVESILDEILNFIFKLNKISAYIRLIFLGLFIITFWALLIFILHSDGNPNSIFLQNPSSRYLVYRQFLSVVFAWDVILILGAGFLGFMITLHLATVYLADIFEIKELSIARKFINEAAFATQSVGSIHIEKGEVREEDLKSPILRIGGPGKAEVNVENVAVFEKIDGSSTIAGTASKKKPYKLEGFERLRSVIDLRELTSTFSIFSRTRDGIPINIIDVNLVFSVFRNNEFRTLTRPYPYTRQGINWLVYQQVQGKWTTALVGLVRGELARFISEHNLSEILAAPGSPEIDQQLNHQRLIAKRIRNNLRHTSRYKSHHLLYGKQKTDGPKYIPIHFWNKKHKKRIRYSKQFMGKGISASNFSPRTTLTNLFFDEFNHSFRNRAHHRGVTLRWIDVGTWDIPSNLILDQHVEAWKIATENEIRSNPRVLSEVKNQARAKEISRLLQQLPSQRFYEYQYQGFSKQEIILKLIQDYAAKLKSARELFLNKKGRVPRQIDTALTHVRKFQLQQYKDEGGFFIGE